MNQMIKRSVLFALGLVSTVPLLQAAPVDLSKLPPAAQQTGVTFDQDIRPLFEASCVRCHGAEKPKAGLRLDSREAVLKGGKEGKVVVPGHSEKSHLVIAVARLDPESAMPPKPREGRRGKAPNAAAEGHGAPATDGSPTPPPRQPLPPAKPLTPEQVGLVRAWIDQGAK